MCIRDRRGAVDFLTKPVNIERLDVLIRRALKERTLEVEVKQLHERLDEKFDLDGIVGNSPLLKDVIERVKKVAQSKATILIAVSYTHLDVYKRQRPRRGQAGRAAASRAQGAGAVGRVRGRTATVRCRSAASSAAST